MKLIDRFAHLAQRLTELLLFLPLHRDLDQRNDSERENRHHADRDYQFHQRETSSSLVRRGDRKTGRCGEKSWAGERLLITPSPDPRVSLSILHGHYCFTVNLIGSIWSVT